MAVLTRDEIQDVKDRTLVEIDVPAWGGSVFMSSLILKDRNRLIGKCADMAKGEDSTLRLEDATELGMDALIAVCCDAAGEPLFTEGDREWLMEKDPDTIQMLSLKAMDMLGLTVQGHEEAVGNSSSTPTDGTKSD